MSPGALEHSEGTISLAQHREGEDRFGPWWCHPGMTFSESLCPQQQKSAELPRQEQPSAGDPTPHIGRTAGDEPALQNIHYFTLLTSTGVCDNI